MTYPASLSPSIENKTTDQLRSAFRLWLISKKYSSSTVRNYLVDVTKYLTQLQTGRPLDQQSLKSYIAVIDGQNNSSRALASLNKFCQFALDQKLVNYNPLDQILNKTSQQPTLTLDHLINQFRQDLASQGKTHFTIKNYLNDIKQFISWAKEIES